MRLSQLYALIKIFYMIVVRKVGPYRRERPLSGVKCALAVQKLYYHYLCIAQASCESSLVRR